MSIKSEEIPERSSKKEMTATAKYLNVAIQVILLLITVYIITETVGTVGIVLFTWHPVFVSIGVSFEIKFLHRDHVISIFSIYF